jgi:glucose uptake protein GlcU
MSDIIIQAILGAIAASIIFIGTYFSTKPADASSTPDWKMIASYGIVGLALGAGAGYIGVPITLEWAAAQVLAYAGIIKAVDMIIVMIWPTPIATYIMKYSGRAFYPIVIVTQNDGVVQTYNTQETGRACQVLVFRDANVARAIGQRIIATVGWSTGFSISPSFIEGVKSVDAAIKLQVGRNMDSSKIASVVVRPGDGTQDEVVKLATGADGISEGVFKHTYKFY